MFSRKKHIKLQIYRKLLIFILSVLSRTHLYFWYWVFLNRRNSGLSFEEIDIRYFPGLFISYFFLSSRYEKLPKHYKKSKRVNQFQQEIQIQSKQESFHRWRNNSYSRTCKHDFRQKYANISKTVSFRCRKLYTKSPLNFILNPKMQWIDWVEISWLINVCVEFNSSSLFISISANESLFFSQLHVQSWIK